MQAVQVTLTQGLTPNEDSQNSHDLTRYYQRNMTTNTSISSL